MATNYPTHTICGKEIPDSILLENGVLFTKKWMEEQAAARPFLPENKLRYWATQVAKTIVIRTMNNGNSSDVRRPTTQEEHDILYKLVYSALLGLNAGETARQTRAAEDAIVNSIEYTCNLFFPEANGYLTIYCPLRNICEEWRSFPAEQLPRVAKDLQPGTDTGFSVEYTDGTEGFEDVHYTVSYEGQVFETDKPGINFQHYNSSKAAHELYDYCELIGLDPYLHDNHYGVYLHRGEWY